MPDSRTATQAIATIKKDPSKILGVTIGSHVFSAAGEDIKKANASKGEPSYTLPIGFDTSKTYIATSVDLDAPFQSWTVLSPLLHSIQPGLTASTDSPALTSSIPPIVTWIPPNPPGPSGPHRYVFLLYEQPANFDPKKFMQPDGKELGIGGRIRWSIRDWEQKTGLGPVVAANYFNCAN